MFNFAGRCIASLIVFIFISQNAVHCNELLELSCIDINNCRQFEQQGVNVTCREGQCHCKDITKNSTTEGETIKCLPTDPKQNNIIGGPCPCRIPNAECNDSEKICYCAQNFVASIDKRRCLQETVSLDDNCELDSQCHAVDNHAICDKKIKKCICRQDFIAYNETCISVADPKTKCENDTNCQIFGAHVQCLVQAQRCTCVDGYIKALTKSECLPIATFSQNCTDDQQCQTHLGPGAACQNNTCQCGDGYFLKQNVKETEDKQNVTQSLCARKIEIGEYCREHRDCYHHQLPDVDQTMSCMFSECNCKWGYYSVNNIDCLKGSKGSLFQPIFKLTILLILVIVGA